MASSSTCFLLVILLVGVLIDGAKAKSMVEEACNSVRKESKEVCTKMLTSEDGKVTQVQESIPTLAGYSVSKAVAFVATTTGKLEKISKELGPNKDSIKEAINTCVVGYNSAILTLSEALGNFNNKKYAEAKMNLMKAIFVARMCDQITTGAPPSVSKVNDEFSAYLSVPIDLIEKVGAGSKTPKATA